jgi:hypothetical protein
MSGEGHPRARLWSMRLEFRMRNGGTQQASRAFLLCPK